MGVGDHAQQAQALAALDAPVQPSEDQAGAEGQQVGAQDPGPGLGRTAHRRGERQDEGRQEGGGQEGPRQENRGREDLPQGVHPGQAVLLAGDSPQEVDGLEIALEPTGALAQ